LVRLKGYNVFKATGEVVDSELCFRSLDQLTRSLRKAGFRIEQVFDDWHRGPFVNTSRFMMIIARRD
jgi:hypothetical protein